MAVTRSRSFPLWKGKTTINRSIVGGRRGTPPRHDKPWITRNAWEITTARGSQETVSENHPGYWLYQGRVNADNGGAFTMKKRMCNDPNGITVIVTPWLQEDPFGDPSAMTQYTYSGPLRHTDAAYSFPPFANSSDAGLDAFGTTAISRCAPTNQAANLATALLEVYHDGLPKLAGHTLWASRTREALEQSKAVGSEFLNVEFGWLPLVSDIREFVTAVINLDKLVTQFLRDSGKVVRRRFQFPPVVTTEEVIIWNGDARWTGPGDNTGVFYNNSPSRTKGYVSRSRTTTIRRWFSGAFMYHAHPDSFLDLQDHSRLSAARQVLGIDLRPDTLWELAPWSWAVDWFSNLGDVIHNLSAAASDSLVMKYGYIMEHSIVHDVYHFYGDPGILPGSTITGGLLDVSSTSEMKLRRKATPYGFGFDMSGLTSRQSAILGALGLTRVRNK